MIVELKVISPKAYGEELANSYKKNAGNTEMIKSFPQRATTDQSYTLDQVAAYRALGRFLVLHNTDLIETTLGFSKPNLPKGTRLKFPSN